MSGEFVESGQVGLNVGFIFDDYFILHQIKSLIHFLGATFLDTKNKYSE